MEHETKHHFMIILISFMMGGCSFYLLTQPMTTVAILQDEVSNTGEIRIDQSGETKSGQSILSKGRAETTNRSTKSDSDNKIQPTNTKIKIIHNGYPKDNYVQIFVNHAYTISSGDLKFVALLDAENGQWNQYRRSILKGSNGYYDYGLCQINRGRYKWIVDDKRFRDDWKRQMQKCLELYKGGTKFYGKVNIPKTIKRFSIIK